MNWEAIGASGELLGSLLALATLIYLAIQTRSINKQAKADARYAFVNAAGGRFFWGHGGDEAFDAAFAEFVGEELRAHGPSYDMVGLVRS